MSKKQIKELLIQTTSKGTKEAVDELQLLDGLLKSSAKSALALSAALRESAKSAHGISNAYTNVTKSIESSIGSVKKFNSSLNGDTKKSTKALSSYLDSLDLLNMSLVTTGANASKAAAALGSMATASQIEEVLNALVHLDKNLDNILGSSEAMTEAIKEGFSGLKEDFSELNTIMERTEDKIFDTNKGLGGLGQSIERVGGRVRGTTKDTDKFNNSVRRLGETGSSSARSFSKLAFGMNPLVSAYAAVAVNVYAVTEAFRLLKEASALQRLEDQTANFAASVSGINVKGLARDLQSLAGGALDSAEALKQAVRGISFGFSPKLLQELTVGARKASVALGRDFADSMDRVIRGISKGEVELLDELGVVTRLETAYKKFAVSMNTTVEQLTDSQRKLALAIEVNSQLAKYASFSTAASGMEQLGVATTDTTNSMLKGLATALDPYAAGIAKFIGALTYTNSAQKKSKESLEIFNKAMEQGNTLQAKVALSEYTEQLKILEEQTNKTGNGYAELTIKMAEQEMAIRGVAEALGYLAVASAVYLSIKGGIVIFRALSMAATVLTTTLAVLTTTSNLLSGSALRLGISLGVATAAAKGLTIPLIAIRVAMVALVGTALMAGVAIGSVGTALYEVATSGANFKDAFKKNFDATIEVVRHGAKELGKAVMQLDPFPSAEEEPPLTKAQQALKDRIDALSKMQGAGAAAEKKEAEAALAYLKDTKEASLQLQQLATNMKAPKTEGEQLFSLLSSISKVNLTAIGDAKGFEELETTFSNLQTQGVIAKDVAFNMGQGLVDAADSARHLSEGLKEVKRQGEINAALAGLAYSGTAEEDLLNNKVQQAQVAKEINQYVLGHKNLNDEIGKQELQTLRDKEIILKAEEASLRTQYSREASLRNIALLNAQIASDMELAGASESEKLIAEREALMRERVAMGNQDTTDITHEIAKLDIDIKRQQVLEAREALETKLKAQQQIQLDNLEARSHTESQVLQLKAEQLIKDMAREGITAAETHELQMQLAILQNKLRITKEQEATAARIASIEQGISMAEDAYNKAGTAAAKAKAQEEILLLKQKKLDEEKATKNPAQAQADQFTLDREKARAAGAANASPFADAAAVMGGIAGLEGLSDLQSTFAGTMSSLSDTYSQFLTDMEGQSGSFMDYLSGNTDALANVLSSSLSLAQAAFAEISKGKIESIDAEIEAEKRRDGKSEESMAKIKKLQAQKIKEEAKAKKASIAMSTATGIMNIWAGPMGEFPPAAAAMSAALAALGMVQLGNVDKAASGQLAALSGSSGNLSISGGNRSNEIDVSRRANAGELAYLQGAKGTGTAGNFTPGKAVGGYSSAGTSIVVGESGPEVITPAVPVNVTPAGQAGSSVQITLSPVFNTSTIDSSGFEQLTQRFSRELYDGLERELRARNRTLDNL